ncbi:hypothetical protein [Streptomyces sp. NPDC059165]|uniref:hypothetical protein n=1 Tax=Streptomyces sp. NPDC059165 TaxID=3346751 RepID=UPI0036B7516D
MPLTLITSDLDAYEAAQAYRRDLQTRYAYAIEQWDALEIATVEALASDYDQRHPDEPSLAAELASTTSLPRAA